MNRTVIIRPVRFGVKGWPRCFALVALFVFLSCLCAQDGYCGAIELSGSVHEDYRGTPKLEFPDALGLKGKSAGDYLRSESSRFKIPPDLSNLEVVGVRQSLVGSHTRYRQMLNGLPVEGAEIIISQRKTDGSVYQVYNNTYPVETPVQVAKVMVGKDAALQKAWDDLRVYGSLRYLPKVDLVYTPFMAGFRLVYKTLIVVDGPFGYWEHKIDAQSGDVISVRRHELSEKYSSDDIPDFTAYQGPTTSLQSELSRLELAAQVNLVTNDLSVASTVDGTALVFDPDPRTTLANDALVDGSAAAAFNAAYFTRPLRQITLNAGVYKLQGPYVSITNFENPKTAPSTTTNGNWTAKRGNNAFNDVMCYFHIDQNQRYLQSLGYTNAASIQAVPIPVDSDGVNGDDNSYYAPVQNSLAFGHGGVDDDEDADVILHEYGHAITYDTTPGFGGGDSGAIGEGFGDYWGASYSWTCTNGATYHPAWAFSWDGHSVDTWTGRFLDMTNLTYDHSHTYTDHEPIAGIDNYSDQLWGTPIYQAFRDLIGLGRPRAEMDKIIIESFFGVGSGVKMRDMANATVQAAMELFPTGPHAAIYFDRFVNQLILLPIQLPNPTLIYPTGGEQLTAGSAIDVLWDRNGALSKAVARLEYSSALVGVSYFYDGVETGTNGWTLSKTGSGSGWYITASSNHSPTRSWFAADDSTTGDQLLTRSSIVVSNGAVLSFWHSYDLESTFDGAVVEISTNGTTWVDLGTNATQNGYTAVISTGYSSPIAGRKAFTGSSGGFVETRIPLNAYAGKTVSIRFRESDDNSDAAVGWWVDDIRIVKDVAWTFLAETPTNAFGYSWTLPGVPGTNYGVRVKLTGSNCTDSSWVTSSAFTLVAPPNRAPSNITISSTSVAENLPVGSIVGSFGTQDPDLTNTFVYTLAAGAGGADNGAFTINGSNLQAAVSFNYETQSNYSIRVQSADQDGLSTQKVFAVTVTDVNETPAFMGVEFLPETNIVFRWSSVPNHQYAVYFSTNLMSGFFILESNIPAMPGVNSYTGSVLGWPSGFWKITTQP